MEGTSGRSAVQHLLKVRPISNLGQVAQSIGQVSFKNLQKQRFSYFSGSPFQSLTALIGGGKGEEYFSVHLMGIFLARACACCLFPFCCVCPRRVCLCLLSATFLDSCRQQLDPSLPSLLIEPAVSHSSFILCSSPNTILLALG